MNWSLQIGCCWAGIHSSGIDVQSATDTVRLIKQAMEVRQGSPKALMFLSLVVKGTKLKTEAMELLGKLTPIFLAMQHYQTYMTRVEGEDARQRHSASSTTLQDTALFQIKRTTEALN